MSELEALAKVVGSLRYARDLLERGNGQTNTSPWWRGSADADDYAAYVRASAAAHPEQSKLQSDVEDPFARFDKEGWIFK